MAITPTAGVDPSQLPTADPIGQDRWDPYATIKSNNYTPALSLLPAGLSPAAAEQMSFNYSKGVWAKNAGGGPSTEKLGPAPKANLAGGSATGASNTYGGGKTPTPAAPTSGGGGTGGGSVAGLQKAIAPAAKPRDPTKPIQPGAGGGDSLSLGDANGGSFSYNGGNYSGGDFSVTNNPPADSTAQAIGGLSAALQNQDPSIENVLAGPSGLRQGIGQRTPPSLAGLIKARIY
jgi:hypothetical protein